MSVFGRGKWGPYAHNAPPPKGPNKKRCSCGRLDHDGDFWPAPKKWTRCYEQHPPSVWGGPIAKGQPHYDGVCKKCGRLEVRPMTVTPQPLKPPKHKAGKRRK